MDLHDVWQENKRWIIGCLLGLVIFWIGWSIVGSNWSTAALTRRIRKLRHEVTASEHYGRNALAAARTEAGKIGDIQHRLREAVEFHPGSDFLLEGKGDPDLHWDVMSRRVRSELVRRAEEYGVDFSEKNLEWSTPDGREAYQAALIGLCLAQQAVRRLLAAHRAVREKNVEALGLASIDSIKIGRGRGLPVRRAARRSPAAGEGPVHEERIRLAIHADEAVVKLFLESCRAESPPITLAEFKMTEGRRPGDPLVVKSVLSALIIRE